MVPHIDNTTCMNTDHTVLHNELQRTFKTQRKALLSDADQAPTQADTHAQQYDSPCFKERFVPHGKDSAM
jgi:hypothetical protein